jgi:hypothetical protein
VVSRPSGRVSGDEGDANVRGGADNRQEDCAESLMFSERGEREEPATESVPGDRRYNGEKDSGPVVESSKEEARLPARFAAHSAASLHPRARSKGNTRGLGEPRGWRRVGRSASPPARSPREQRCPLETATLLLDVLGQREQVTPLPASR